MNETELKAEAPPRFTRGKLTEVRVYEVQESELSTLERGSPNSIFLNFSIFLASTATSFWIALNDSSVESEKTFIVYTVIIVVGYAITIILITLWLRNRNDFSKTIKKIRDRIGECDQENDGTTQHSVSDPIEEKNKFSIIKAEYKTANHSADVTNILNDLIRDNELSTTASNDIFTDPDKGTEKKLHIEYSHNGKSVSAEFNEKDTVKLPQ